MSDIMESSEKMERVETSEDGVRQDSTESDTGSTTAEAHTRYSLKRGKIPSLQKRQSNEDEGASVGTPSVSDVANDAIGARSRQRTALPSKTTVLVENEGSNSNRPVDKKQSRARREQRRKDLNSAQTTNGKHSPAVATGKPERACCACTFLGKLKSAVKRLLGLEKKVVTNKFSESKKRGNRLSSRKRQHHTHNS